MAALDALAVSVLGHLARMGAQQMSSCIWGFASMGYIPMTALLDASAGAMLRTIGGFSAGVAVHRRQLLRSCAALHQQLLRSGTANMGARGGGQARSLTVPMWHAHIILTPMPATNVSATIFLAVDHAARLAWAYARMEYRPADALLGGIMQVKLGSERGGPGA